MMNSSLHSSWPRSIRVLSASLVLSTFASAQTKVIVTDLTDCDRHPCPASVRATDINDFGQVVGHYFAPSDDLAHWFSWTAEDGFVEFARWNGGTTSLSINNAGWVVGSADTATGFHPILAVPAVGAMQHLGTLGGQSSYATAFEQCRPSHWD
jgi:hypothetical protein